MASLRELLQKRLNSLEKAEPVKMAEPATLSRLELLRAKLANPTMVAAVYSTIQEEPPKEEEIIYSRRVNSNLDFTLGGWNKYGEWITYNEQQRNAVIMAGVDGQSCCVIGSAGTGKTSVMNGISQVIIQSGRIPLNANFGDHKYLRSGTPGIAFCSFTHVATENLRRNLPDDLKGNALTFHKLIEFQPVPNSVQDPETGEWRNVLRFEETRHERNPLPDDLKVIVMEESSMLDVSLYNKVRKALPHHVQFIMLGDIQQLVPVFGSAVLGFKMGEYPLVALTEIYRQANDSPIVKFAYRILEGKPIPFKELKDWNSPGLGIFPFQEPINDPVIAEDHFGKFYCKAADAGFYDPLTDIILIPFNVAPGQVGINRMIANHLAKKRGAIVFEVCAGFEDKYFSVGDKVWAKRKEGFISKITKNPFYFGKQVQPESIYLDYWGVNNSPNEKSEQKYGAIQEIEAISAMSEEELFASIDLVLNSEDSEKRRKQSSHEIEVTFPDGEIAKLSSAGEVNELQHAYALTVHKAQGSEWRRVFAALHRRHGVMLSRELLYTLVTRARESLHILCEKDTFIKGVVTQEIPGETIEEKIAHFKEKAISGSIQPMKG